MELLTTSSIDRPVKARIRRSGRCTTMYSVGSARSIGDDRLGYGEKT
jgi:hypothetical protein